MTAKELITLLEALPPDRLVCADVTDLGFVDVLEVSNNPEDPGALLILDDKGDMQDAVREVNAVGK